VLMGEPDVLKTIQLMPGVKNAGEGGSGFLVRGGTIDQNLILLDEATVYNPSHLLGFFSVFNSDALKNVTLYKGGMPAEYGGRASSVMDIRMKDGNNKKFGVSGGIGAISSKLTLEGPIVKDKGSFIVSGRRTYADLFLKLSPDENLQNTKLYFYDFNAKANYALGKKDRLYLSFYTGRDNFGFSDVFSFNWGNQTGTLRWNHLFSDKLFSNTTLIYSNYDYEFGIGSGENEFALGSNIEDFNFKQDFNWFAHNNHNVKFGVNLMHHEILPGEIRVGEDNDFEPFQVDKKYSLEGAAYIQNEHKVSSRLTMKYGLRYSYFNYLGDGTAYEFNDKGEITKQTEYDRWESIQAYGGLEPRLSANYMITANSSFKLGYNRAYQYIHLLSNSTAGNPTDVWTPSTNNIKPQLADQISLGYFRNFNNNAIKSSIEVYYKDMQNLIEYRTGASLLLNNSVESELIFGKGMAYGTELMVEKTKGKLTGWMSYTLSRTLRSFDDIDNGNLFPARQDRIHDVSLVAMYAPNSKWQFSAAFVYYTGDAVTFPVGKYEVDGITVPYYTERNGYRMPEYHRLDLGATWYRKRTEKVETSWNFSVYNAYGRENAYTITFQENDDTGETEAVKLALFKYIPSITYNFKF
ncbi:MAG: TonB-dependent receptor plug domain-containing protein, partial [Bacteroidetes bacterium]|nr:TonB-dependent receptor plug domain-containing protein [Bacteroidota bacterium]